MNPWSRSYLASAEAAIMPSDLIPKNVVVIGIPDTRLLKSFCSPSLHTFTENSPMKVWV